MQSTLTQEEVETKACGCYGCDDGRHPGHFLCDTPDPDMLAAEQRGEVYRELTDNGWKWFVA